MLHQFYRKPLFLQETFFHALIELHQQIRRKAEAYPITQALEQQLNQTFQAFCSKNTLRDVDVTEMRHIPLPIQRKLAHDGYLPKFFYLQYPRFNRPRIRAACGKAAGCAQILPSCAPLTDARSKKLAEKRSVDERILKPRRLLPLNPKATQSGPAAPILKQPDTLRSQRNRPRP